MATRSIVKDIVKIEEGVKKLKATQFAYGKQYVGLETIVVMNGTIRYTTGWQGNKLYDLYGYFTFTGQTDFPLVGLKKCRVFLNNVETGISGPSIDQYGQNCNYLSNGQTKLSLQRYIEGDETLNAQNYEFHLWMDGMTMPIPEGTALRVELTLNANTVGTTSLTQYEY